MTGRQSLAEPRRKTQISPTGTNPLVKERLKAPLWVLTAAFVYSSPKDFNASVLTTGLKLYFAIHTVSMEKGMWRVNADMPSAIGPYPFRFMKAMNSSFFADQARQDRERSHYTKKTRLIDLWETDRKYLLTLPESGFEAFRLSAMTN